MPADQSPMPAEGGGGIPRWVLIGGAGAVAVALYLRYRKSAGSNATLGEGTSGVATDPNTGLPINPVTGLPFISGSPDTGVTMSQWARNAEQWASTHGFGAGLASKAIYDYINANPLTNSEAALIDKVLSGYGYPPDQLPFLGNPPSKSGGSGSGGGKTANVYFTTSKVVGPSRLFTPVNGQKLVDLLLKSGLITRVAHPMKGGPAYMTTAKFGGPIRAFNPNVSLSVIIKALTQQHIIVPTHVTVGG